MKDLRLSSSPGPKQMSMEVIRVDLLAVEMEFDQLETFPITVELDTHYFLNSKVALRTSGLPRYVFLS